MSEFVYTDEIALVLQQALREPALCGGGYEAVLYWEEGDVVPPDRAAGSIVCGEEVRFDFFPDGEVQVVSPWPLASDVLYAVAEVADGVVRELAEEQDRRAGKGLPAGLEPLHRNGKGE